MNKADIMLLYDYNYWATKQLLIAAERVKPEQFVAPGAFPWGGLRGTLVHTLDAEYGWRLRLQHNRDQDEELKESDFPKLKDLVQRWQEEEALMREYLSSLDDNALKKFLGTQSPRAPGASAYCGTACSTWSIMGHSIAARLPLY